MIQKISSDNSESFLDRFNNFHDGLVRSIQIEYPKGASIPSVFVTIEVQDWGAENNEWVNLTLEAQDVTKCTLMWNELYKFSVILKFTIGFFNELIYLNFTAAILSSMPNVEEFEQSSFLIVGKQCFWHTTSL